MNPRLALFASITLGIGLTVGCGGSSNTDLLNGGGGQRTGTGGSGATGTGGSGTGGSGTGGSGTAGSGTGGSGATGTGGSGATGTGGSGTGGSGTGGSGGGNTSGAGVVLCGSSPCDVSHGGACCASQDGFDCSSGPCPSMTAVYKCDGPEDCPGQHCCGTIMQYNGNYFYGQITCQQQCYQGQRVMCGSHPGACPNGGKCVSSQLLPGYHACGN